LFPVVDVLNVLLQRSCFQLLLYKTLRFHKVV